MAGPSNEELLRSLGLRGIVDSAPAELIEAMIEQESGGDPNAVSAAGAQGLMQLLPSTFKALGGRGDIRDPTENVRIGTKYINRLLKQFNGDAEKALSAYHSGPKRVSDLIKAGRFPGGLGPFGRKYAPGILARAERPPRPKRKPDRPGPLGELGETAEGMIPARARALGPPSFTRPGDPLPSAPVTDEMLINQQRLNRTLELGQRRVEQNRAGRAEVPQSAPAGPAVTDEMLLESIMGRRNPPGPLEQFAGGAGRVAGATGRGFSETFGPDPITGPAALEQPRPELGVLEPLVTGPAQVASGGIQAAKAAVRGIPATLMAAATGFEQALIEFGVSETAAKNATTMTLGLFEAGSIVTGTRPVLFRGSIEAAKRMGRFMIASRRKEFLEAQIIKEKAERARFLAINAARAEIRRLAKPGTSEAVIRQRAFDIELRRLDDALVKAQGEEALMLRAPDEIITDIATLRAMRLPIEIQERAIKVAQDILVDRGIPLNSLTPRRVQQLVADLLETDDAFSIRLFAEIEASGMSKTDFIQAFLVTGSEAGRTLRARSRFFKEDPVLTAFREMARTDDDVAEAVRRVIEGTDELGNPLTPGRRITAFDLGESTWTTASRDWRSLLISLPTTAVRNLIDSGFFRVTLQAQNQMIDQMFRRLFLAGGHKGVSASEMETFGKSWEILADVFQGLARDLPTQLAKKVTGGRAGTLIKPSNPKRMLDTLIRMFPEVRQTFANIELDIAIRAGMRAKGPLAPVDKFINSWFLAMNRTQEFIVRRASLTSRLDAELKKIGSSLEEVVDLGRIPAGFNEALKIASDETLLLTFAKSPEVAGALGKFFQGYANMIEASKVLVILEPFPRFIFNATKLILENTATGGLRLMKPLNRAKLAQGDFSPLARELTGTALLATAYAIRQGDFPGITPGARFDEVIGPDDIRVSMAPFATIIPHLFLADLIIRIEEGRLLASTDLFKEFRKGLLSSAPQTGRAAEGIEDAFKALLQIGTKAEFSKFLEFMGESVGAGVFRPVQLVKDFRGEWNEGVTLARETQGQGFSAAIRNIVDPTGELGIFPPLPVRESPTRAATPQQPRVTLPGGRTISGPLFSQGSGAPVREPRNPIERAIVTQGFMGKALSAKTGSKKADALVSRFSGPMLELVGNVVVTGDLYRILPNSARQEIIRNLIIITRAPALRLAKRLAPRMFDKLKIDKLPDIQRRAAEANIDRLFQSAGIDTTSAKLMQELEAQGNLELDALGLGPQGGTQ